MHTKPFIKWVGGKQKLTSSLLKLVPNKIERLVEPFLGSGALFFALQPKGAVLSDANEDLINAYIQLRDYCPVLMYALSELQKAYDSYSIEKREQLYNSIKDRFNHPENYPAVGLVDRAAYLIFLNKTCYSGIWRVNKKGEFNVGFGRYKKPSIYNRQNLIKCSELLQDKRIVCRQYYEVIPRARPGDLVYIDPPYLPVNGQKTSFTKYTKNGFSLMDHNRILLLTQRLTSRGIKWMQSNSLSPKLKELYPDCNFTKITRSGAVNSDVSNRKQVGEYVIRNFDL